MLLLPFQPHRHHVLVVLAPPDGGGLRAVSRAAEGAISMSAECLSWRSLCCRLVEWLPPARPGASAGRLAAHSAGAAGLVVDLSQELVHLLPLLRLRAQPTSAPAEALKPTARHRASAVQQQAFHGACYQDRHLGEYCLASWRLARLQRGSEARFSFSFFTRKLVLSSSELIGRATAD